MKRHLLIDGDVLAYSCGFACQHDTHLLIGPNGEVLQEFTRDNGGKKAASAASAIVEGSEIHTETIAEPIEYVLSTVKRSINNMMEVCRGDSYSVFVSPSITFRHRLATIQPYKGNRDPNQKPKHLKEIKEYILRYQNGEVAEDVEADDLMGIYASVSDGYDYVICTTDKDLDQVPGKHYNFGKQTRYHIPDDYAEYFLYAQILAGDAVDNIPGLPRVGLVTAMRMVEGYPLKDVNGKNQVRAKVLSSYAQKFPDDWKTRVEEVAQLIRILRKPNEERRKFWEEGELLDIEATLSLNLPAT